MQKEVKYCPLRHMAREIVRDWSISLKCSKNCMWWTKNGCAVVVCAELLSRIFIEVEQ